MEDVWYFAYGSNMLVSQKERRTGPIRDMRRALLRNHRLAFNKVSFDGTGKANVMSAEGHSVWGVIFRCTKDTIVKMDDYEKGYVRTEVRVLTEIGIEIDAITYIAEAGRVDDALKPSEEYLGTIVKGAGEQGLPEEYVKMLQAL